MAHVFRVAWVLVSIVLILFGMLVFDACQSFMVRLDLLHQLPPICLPLDLSAHGIYSGSYRRSFDAALDDQLRLVIAGSPSEEEIRKWLDGLYAVMILKDEKGGVLNQQVIGASDFHPWNRTPDERLSNYASFGLRET